MQSVKEKQHNAFDVMKDQFGYINRMQTPRLEKVVINVGTGSINDKDKIELIKNRLTQITGQYPVETAAKKSIASFGIREGQSVGFQVTLRGVYMINFLEKLIHVALPRMKDFRGLSLRSIDEMGNYTIGLPEHTVFPETSDEELKNVFGMSVTIVTTADTQKEAEAFLRHIGLPLKEKESAAHSQ